MSSGAEKLMLRIKKEKNGRRWKMKKMKKMEETKKCDGGNAKTLKEKMTKQNSAQTT